jgi:hypothetical protein
MPITDQMATGKRLKAAVGFLDAGMVPPQALAHAGSSINELREAQGIGMPEAIAFLLAAMQESDGDWLT